MLYTCYHCSIDFSVLQVTGDRCDTPTPVGVLAPDGDNNITPVRVTIADSPLPTVSVAVKMEQFSFVFVATDDPEIRGVSTWCSQLSVLASIPGRTFSEDGPGIDCLRMRHLLPRNWVIWKTSYMLSKIMTSQQTEVD